MCTWRRLRSGWASAQSDQSLRSALNGQIRTQVFFMWTATAQAGLSFRGHIILSRRTAFSTRLHGIKMTIETGHIISRAPIQSCKCSVNTQISLHHKIFYVRIALSLELMRTSNPIRVFILSQRNHWRLMNL